jgi:hypothetical protein
LQGAFSRYRSQEDHDAPQEQPIPGIPFFVPDLLRVSSMLSRLVDGRLVISDRDRLRLLLTDWTWIRNRRAILALIQQQMGTEVCVNLPRVVAGLVGNSDAAGIPIKFAVSLVEICKAHARPEVLQLAIHVLSSRSGGRLPQGVTVESFFDRSVFFDGGFSSAVPVPVRRALIQDVFVNLTARGVVFTQIEDGGYVPQFDSPKTALAFGRAMGLSVRENVDLKWLQLSHGFAYVLNPWLRSRHVDVEEETAACYPDPTKVSRSDRILIRTAIKAFDAALGPGQAERFDMNQWISGIFGVRKEHE